MPLGVLQTRDGQAPGTVILLDKENRSAAFNFKHANGKNSDVVLVPQPSNDPNDPLNWPRWKKDVTLAVVFLNTIILASVPAPILAPATVLLTTVFHVSLDKIAVLSGYQLLLVGCIGPIVSALARKYGKRPQFVFASIMGIIGTAVCVSANTDYNRLMAGRLLQGFGTTAFESLSIAVIGDMYFVHERPVRTGAITLTLTCVASLVSIIGGPITANLGWRYMFIIHLPFTIVGAIAIIFFLPETQFVRTQDGDKMGLSPTALDEHSSGSKAAHSEQLEDTANADTKPEFSESKTVSTSQPIPKKSYISSLALFNGTYTDENIFKLLFTPLAVLLNPAVVWTLLIAGLAVALYVSTAYIVAQIWSPPPYLLTPAGNGYFFVGGLLGGVIGGLPGAYLVDAIANFLVRRNRGTYEPEFRIPAQIISVALYALGWLLWMWRVEHPTPKGYFVGSFCLGCICTGITIATLSANLYILDAFPADATEIFILQMLAKNLLFYGFSTFINAWAAVKGPGAVFRTYGIVSLCLSLTSVGMYIFGKRLRRALGGVKWLDTIGAVRSPSRLMPGAAGTAGH